MRLSIILLVLFIGASCNNDPRAKLQNKGMFGEPFEAGTSTLYSDTLPKTDSSLVSISFVSGVVEKYCTGEGCWLVLKTENGESIKVITKDKSYVLPRNIDNKRVIAKGKFLPIDPEKPNKLVFEASGILIE